MDNLQEFIKLLSGPGDTLNSFTPMDVIFTITLSFVLALIIGWVYQTTHRGTSYSQSYVQTLVIMAMVVALIMLIIGSNIARAFTLVGALSIVRFRNAVKETRDVGFIFFAMAIGMAVGTRFYMVAVISTFLVSFFLWAMVKTNMFAKTVKEQILRIRVPGDIPYETLFDQIFSKYLLRANLIAVESVQAGMLTELLYGIEFKRGVTPQDFVQELRKLNDNNKIALVRGYHEVDL